jgi:hypothetical protein
MMNYKNFSRSVDLLGPLNGSHQEFDPAIPWCDTSPEVYI